MNAVDKDKQTALHIAAQKGHVDVAKVLIQMLTLHFTSQLRDGHVDVAKVLIQNGADVNAVDKNKGRHFTARS